MTIQIPIEPAAALAMQRMMDRSTEAATARDVAQAAIQSYLDTCPHLAKLGKMMAEANAQLETNQAAIASLAAGIGVPDGANFKLTISDGKPVLICEQTAPPNA